jgi:hypothetical protein
MVQLLIVLFAVDMIDWLETGTVPLLAVVLLLLGDRALTQLLAFWD